MFVFTDYNNADAVVIKLLKSLSVNISAAAIVAELDKHPDYPSLLAVSDVLNNFYIENNAFRVPFDELENLRCPFLVHVNTNGGEFLVVNNINGKKASVSSEKWDKHTMYVDEFKKKFTGIVLTAEPSEKKSSRTFTSTINEIKTPFVAINCLLVFIAGIVFHTSYFENYNWQVLLLTAFKTAGLIISILLLVQSIDSNNPLIQKLCQADGNSDCKAILSSKAAKVFEGLSWSEIGFFYFGGTWLVLMFGNHSVSMMHVLAILNIVSLPYTFYSIYYQAHIAKQWCVLCCAVQALLWLEFIPSITAIDLSFTLPIATEWSTLFIALLLPVILWIIMKPLFLKLQQLPPLKEQLRKFKYNTELFNAMLNNQPKYPLPSEDWSIVLGNKEANNSITMVTNPYCPPCSKIHKLLDELLDNRGDIQARIVFTANNTDEDIKTPVSSHLMALSELPNKTIVKRALNDWFEQKQKDYKTWAKYYPVQISESNFHKLDRQKAWCKMTEVSATPTVLLNGHRMPELYHLSDLKYMLD
ncbi:MAG: hypothetical protein JWQ57_4922 [Mucilaginibacter sp.]|nr:hypothetical protein [Mucilaginibacter sp.]